MKHEKKGAVVLAYSGGLDTSVCVPLLREEYGFKRVITVTVDVGQPERELAEAAEKAKRISDKHYTLDAKQEFLRDYVFPLLKANGSYEGYVLGTSMARPLIAREVVQVAKQEGADALAHGCTGKGNDQLRFEAIFRETGLSVIAPMRDMNLTREWEIEYAKRHGIPVAAKSKKWSVDENIWSRSIEGGALEDPSFEPPEEIYAWTVAPEKAPAAEKIKIEFADGEPVALNGKRLAAVALVTQLNSIGGKHGIGRTDMIEDRVLGLKARENYEHPAATILLTAHADLERLVLTREELAFKQSVDAKYGELVYKGLVDEPLFVALQAFVNKTQERVGGEVSVNLCKGTARVVSRSSPYALYSADMVSFDSKTINQKDAEGYAKFHGFQARMYKRVVGK
jgi:argininosuccinate synthase